MRKWEAVLVFLVLVVPSPVLAEDDAEFQAMFNDPIKLPEHMIGTNRLEMTAPTEGYYACSSIELGKFVDPQDFLALTNYRGFDLFSNGTYRLRNIDKTFDSQLFHWKHNPVSGRVAFTDGPLSVRFKWPTHMDYWKLTHWISTLEIRDQLDKDGIHRWLACRSDDPTLSTR